jgi:hypothetical protein
MANLRLVDGLLEVVIQARGSRAWIAVLKRYPGKAEAHLLGEADVKMSDLVGSIQELVIANGGR